MTTSNYIFLDRFNTFYFRQRTPFDILNAIPSAKKEVKISLRTKNKTHARQLARHHKVMFDLLFNAIRNNMDNYDETDDFKHQVFSVNTCSAKQFKALDPDEQAQAMLEKRTEEAINDQQFTQQLFFLLERKDRIKKAFNNIEALQHHSLSDIDLSGVAKINHFIAIIDLLSSPSLTDPTPYLNQITFKSPVSTNYSNVSGTMQKSIKISRLVIKRSKPTPSPQTPKELASRAKKDRSNTENTAIAMLDGFIETGETPAIRTDIPNNDSEDLIIEGISLDTEEDAHNFAALLAMLDKGDSNSLKASETIAKPIVVPKTMLKVSELFQKFYDERQSEWNGGKTHSAYTAAFQTFIDIVGDLFVDELDYECANTFIDSLQKLPINRRKNPLYKDKSISEILAMDITQDLLSTTQVNNYITRINSAFSWATQRKYLSLNILDRMKVRNRRGKDNSLRQRFEADELSRIFNSEKYIKNTHIRTYEYWLPLLGLYTGARIGELSQLHLTDIYTEDKTWIIDINDDDDKKVKTPAAVRKIPVHKTLIELGFIKYIQFLKKCYETETTHTTQIFPDLVKGRDGYGHNSSKAFNRYLEQINIKEKGKSFHSLRHTFADERKQAEDNTAMTAELMGHEIDSETLNRYGKDYKITLKKAAIDRYQPLSVAQIKKIQKFKLWKEFSPRQSLQRASSIIDAKKSIYSNKMLHKALCTALNIPLPQEEPPKEKPLK